MFEAMIDPTSAPVSADGAGRAPRPPGLSGRTVGLLATVKKNAPEFLDAVGELLVAEHGAAGLVRRQKRSISDPVPPQLLAELAQSCDVVVVGVGDCGSCSASAVADGIAFEAAGVPAVVICTEAFTASADAMAAIAGSPGYAFVRTAHPVAPLDAAQLAERARVALPEIVTVLTESDRETAAA